MLQVVTLWYRSPEVLLTTSYATPVDAWSCGCIFAELFRRKPLFCGQSEADQLSKIFEYVQCCVPPGCFLFRRFLPVATPCAFLISFRSHSFSTLAVPVSYFRQIVRNLSTNRVKTCPFFRVFRVIGTPSIDEWPETCSLPWNTYANLSGTSLYSLVPDICPQGKDLLERMLTFDSGTRITASEALQHPYFRDEGYVPVTYSPPSCRSTPVPMSCSSNDDSGHSADGNPDN